MKGGPRAIVVIVGLLAGIAPVVAQSARERDPSWVAPAKKAARSNPLADRPGLRAGGAKLFAQKCNTCHGEDGHGTDQAPSLAAPEVQAQTDGALFWKVSSGNARAGMPSFSFLPEAQRWQLVLQLRGLAP